MDYDIAEPHADAIIQSARSIGYDLPTAIADIMDNSIAAGASNIWLAFFWDGERSWISIRDDGSGMNEKTLVNAMRLGSLSPLAYRSDRDLGRFGLGLKTASFSQCKRLIVRTKAENAPACTRCWDLDYVTESREWRLFKEISELSESHLAEFNPKSHGTIVLWEDMDRLVAHNQTENRMQQDRFYQRVDQVIEHNSMVFHKFLERPNGGLTCWANGNKVSPWNPFLPREAATQGLPEEHLHYNGQTVDVFPYILPHQSRLKPEIFKLAGGSRGWNDLQGFYVYRNGRMLVAGDWLGLGLQKEEHCKLARIELNITTAMDMDWQIDVKKSRARPPAAIRDDLRRIASLTRTKAVEVYRSRGKVLTRARSDEVVFLWDTLRRHGKNRFIINRDYPAVATVRRLCGEHTWEYFDALLRLIEETLPVSCANENPDTSRQVQGQASTLNDLSQLSIICHLLFKVLVASGNSKGHAIELLATMAPFNQYPELLATLEDGEGDNQSDDR
ncbi:MAG: ATP-binding protein [Firmicutes bacterium]|nr:ATP-binding protein [Bacillota bacterium]